MATFVAVPLKTATDVDLRAPLKKFIIRQFGKDLINEQSLNEFNRLRINATTKQLDKHDSAVDLLMRYYDQLSAVEMKLPMTENEIRIQFTWKDAFDRGSLFGVVKKTICSGVFERVCVLFNIAAMFSQLACNKNLHSDDGLKTAAKYFQQSAGLFTYLADNVVALLQQTATPDMFVESLHAYSLVMLAQAQETFLKKSQTDKMKPTLIAKLSSQTSDMYSDALKACQSSIVRASLEHLDQDWIPIIAGKQSLYLGLAEYQMSLIAHQGKMIGEEITRLKHADDLMTATESESGLIVSDKDLHNKIKRAYESIKKDNDFIYNERIPEIANLAVIGRAKVAKPLAPDFKQPMSKNFVDLFDNLLPLVIHDAMATYSGRSSEIVSMEIGRLREQTTLLNAALVSLNLPAAVEVCATGSAIPQSVIDYSARVQELGGILKLEQTINELPDCLLRNKEILDEAVRLLDEERSSDDEMRSKFTTRWTRVRSEQLTQPLRTDINKYQTIISNATQADETVRDKFNRNKPGMVLLSKPLEELKSAVPTAGASVGTGAKKSPAAAELRSLMKDVERIKASRDQLEQELKDTDNAAAMKSNFLSALRDETSMADVSEQNIYLLFSPLRESVSSSIHQQEELLGKIQTTNQRFISESGGSATSQRDEVLKSLSSAYTMFNELTIHLNEGTKFYVDLTELLLRLQNKVQDFIFARKTEKDDHIREIQSNIASPTPLSTAATVAQQQSNQATARAPPSRPSQPPPSQTTGQSAASASAPAAADPNTAPNFPNPYMPYSGYGAPPPIPPGYNPYMPMPQYPGYPSPYNYPPPPQPGQYPPPPQGQYNPYYRTL